MKGKISNGSYQNSNDKAKKDPETKPTSMTVICGYSCINNQTKRMGIPAIITTKRFWTIFHFLAQILSNCEICCLS